jgi:polyisoprenoid-binding protein YceI
MTYRAVASLPFWLGVAATLVAVQPARPQTSMLAYTIDPKVSEVRIQVDKSGVFGFAGHTHDVRAPVTEGRIDVAAAEPLRSTVHVAFDASALRVSGEGEPKEDVPVVQRTMESDKVLDVAKFPRIVFSSTAIELIERQGDYLKLRVTGDLTLHGVTESERADVSVVLTNDRLTAEGTLTVQQTHYGIEPVTAGGGTVRVKDAVRITFTLVANHAA